MTNHLDDSPQPTYDPQEFRVPGTDSSGHHDRIWCRIMRGELMQVRAIFESHRFPYRTEGDLMRHAIYRLIRYLDGLEVLPSNTRQVDMMIEVLRQEEFQQDFINVFENMNNVVANHLATGAEGEARRVLATIINHVDGMPEGYWKGRYRKEIGDKFGHLLDSGKSMSLLGEMDEGETA